MQMEIYYTLIKNLIILLRQSGILSANLNDINLDNTNYEEDDLYTIILGRLLTL